MISCGCKGKAKYQTHIGDEVLETCIDCISDMHEAVMKKYYVGLKGVAENDMLRSTDSNRQALHQQKES